MKTVTKAALALWRRLSTEPIVLWNVFLTTWAWKYPAASLGATAVINAVGVLYQRSLSTPTVKAKENELAAVEMGVNVQKAAQADKAARR